MPIIKWLIPGHLETSKKIYFIHITGYFFHYWIFSSIMLSKVLDVSTFFSSFIYNVILFYSKRNWCYLHRLLHLHISYLQMTVNFICFHAIILWQAHTFPELAKAGNHAKNLGNPQPLGRSPRDLREWRVDLPISFGLLYSPSARTSCSCCSQLAIPPTHQTI